jgi:uncharacterized membrane protein YhhN
MGGDILLMFKNDDLFIFGLASFLIAHVLYILAFAGNLKTTHTKVPATKRLLIALPFAAFVVIFLFILKGYMLGNAETAPLFIPVAVYASVIGLMGIFAAFRRNATNAESFRLIFTGALLFICSDTMIGVNRFITPVPQASLLIMGTYITAQYLIVKGTLCHTSLPR